MKRAKYYYNTQTLSYERIEETPWRILLRILGFLSAVVVTSMGLILVAYYYFDSPKEKQLKREIAQMELQYELLNKRLDQMAKVLEGLEERDDNIYRVIFEAEPIPSSVRNAGMGGVDKYRELQMYENGRLMIETARKMDKISKQLYIQSKSYDELNELIKNKSEMLASIPAIQPVANKDLKRIASGYGYRIDPIYKVRKMHYGIDFTAPVGTEVYATGNGVIAEIKRSKRGYGNHVIIDHGYGYKTLYAHLSRFNNLKVGQRVKRGDVIGYVGSTGKSTAPHLHYEILKDGRKIDPVNFFYNDLTPEEYDQIVELANRSNQSFD